MKGLLYAGDAERDRREPAWYETMTHGRIVQAMYLAQPCQCVSPMLSARSRSARSCASTCTHCVGRALPPDGGTLGAGIGTGVENARFVVDDNALRVAHDAIPRRRLDHRMPKVL